MLSFFKANLHRLEIVVLTMEEPIENTKELLILVEY